MISYISHLKMHNYVLFDIKNIFDYGGTIMFNQILLAGRLVFEPKLVEVDDNKKVCQIRVAVPGKKM